MDALDVLPMTRIIVHDPCSAIRHTSVVLGPCLTCNILLSPHCTVTYHVDYSTFPLYVVVGNKDPNS